MKVEIYRLIESHYFWPISRDFDFSKMLEGEGGKLLNISQCARKKVQFKTQRMEQPSTPDWHLCDVTCCSQSKRDSVTRDAHIEPKAKRKFVLNKQNI